jgi:hypothetical protein
MQFMSSSAGWDYEASVMAPLMTFSAAPMRATRLRTPISMSAKMITRTISHVSPGRRAGPTQTIFA